MWRFLIPTLLLTSTATAQTQPTTLPADDPLPAIRKAVLGPFAPTDAEADAILTTLERRSTDPSPAARREVAILAGYGWFNGRASPPPGLPRATALEDRLARDADAGVRHGAVTGGLKWAAAKDDAVVRGLVDAAVSAGAWNGNVAAQAMFGLNGTCGGKATSAQLLPLLEPYWANAATDPDRAAEAYVVYLGAIGEDPPNVDRLADVGHFELGVQGRAGASVDDVRNDLRQRLPKGTVTAVELGMFHGQPWGQLAIDGVARRRVAVDALRKSHVVTPLDDVTRFLPQLFTPAEYAAFVQTVKQRPMVTPPAATQPNYVAAFQDLYDYLGRTYPEFALKGIDWPAVGRELLPRAATVKTDGEFGLLVEQLVARLQDSHAVVEQGTAVVPQPDWPAWDPGFACLDDDRGRPVVYTVEPNSPADHASVRPGMAVVSINGVPAEQAVGACARRLKDYAGYSSERTLRYDAVRSFTAQMENGTVVHLVLESPDGHRSTVDVAATCGERYLPRLPVPRAGISDSADVGWTTLAPGMGYIYVRRIRNGLETDLDAALKSLGPITGLVIDVRGNSGGGFDADTALANFDPKANGDRPRYFGPIALLTDERCISAGEGWSSWFVANHRARLFGSTTAGASSRKVEYALTNGLYKVVVPVKPYTGFLDRAIEVQGLVPDEPVRCNAADLAAGRDTVVEAAERWLATQRK